MRRINRPSKHEGKNTPKSSIKQVFTGRKCLLGAPRNTTMGCQYAHPGLGRCLYPQLLQRFPPGASLLMMTVWEAAKSDLEKVSCR